MIIVKRLAKIPGSQMKIKIPGLHDITIEHIVFDLNGTLALDGLIEQSVADRLNVLAKDYHCHVLTAGTHGGIDEARAALDFEVRVIDHGHEAEEKRKFVAEVGTHQTAAVGNGANDKGMLEEAALSIAVCGHEGMCPELVKTADIIVNDIDDAIELFIKPERIVATLRS